MYTKYIFNSDSHRITDHGKRTSIRFRCVSSLVGTSQLTLQTYSLTIQLNNSMEQQHPSGSLWNSTNLIHLKEPLLCAHSSLLAHLSSQTVYALSFYISLISTLILTCQLRLGLPSVFYPNLVWISLFPHAYYISSSSHFPLKSAQLKWYSSTMILTGIRVFHLHTNATLQYSLGLLVSLNVHAKKPTVLVYAHVSEVTRIYRRRIPVNPTC